MKKYLFNFAQEGKSLILVTMLMSLASHSLVLNHRRGVLEDRWLLMKFDRANYDIVEGLEFDWRVENALFGVRLVPRRKGETAYIFTGPKPWLTPFASGLNQGN